MVIKREFSHDDRNINTHTYLQWTAQSPVSYHPFFIRIYHHHIRALCKCHLHLHAATRTVLSPPPLPPPSKTQSSFLPPYKSSSTITPDIRNVVQTLSRMTWTTPICVLITALVPNREEKQKKKI